MKPSARLIGLTMPVDDPDYEESLGFTKPEDLIEYSGRWDYGERSVSKMGDPTIIARWLASGEESMVEMVDATFLIECSRVVTHELVRHRLASYQQESQRFVRYSDETTGTLFYTPSEMDGDGGSPQDQATFRAYAAALDAYNELLAAGVPKQLARYVLPNATRTRIIVKMNLREWRHVLHLRMHTSAQPEMQEVMRMVHAKLQRQFGTALFPDDIAAIRGGR